MDKTAERLPAVNPEIDLSICLVNVNSREMTLRCLRSIEEHTEGVPYEIILVDNASKDGSAEQIGREFPSVQIIRFAQLQGFSANSNAAIRRSVGRYVLLLNNDTSIGDDALTRLVRFLDQHPACGAAGGQLRNPDGTLQFNSGRRRPNLYTYVCDQLLLKYAFPKSRLFGYEYLPYRRYFGPPIPVDVLPGACMLVRREVLETVGLLDEGYVLYYEDIDWSLRIGQAGWQLYYVPHATITHYGDQTISRVRTRGRIEEYRSAVRFFRTRLAAGPFRLALIRLFRLVSLFERMFLYTFMALHPARRELARENVRSCWQVIRWHCTRERRERATATPSR
jgi:GT2 family glycosyltransferase